MKESRDARSLLIVLLPAPAGPSIVMIGRLFKKTPFPRPFSRG
jgi:hypothetical protein